MMLRRFTFLGVLVAVVAAASLFGVLGRGGGKAEAQAGPPSCFTSADVLNISTGVGGIIGAPDEHWTVNSSPAFVSGPTGSYVNPPPSGSQWINPTGNASDNQPLATYVYSTSFTVPTGFQPTLALQFAADNGVTFALTGEPGSFTGTVLDPGNPNESYQVLHPEAFAANGFGPFYPTNPGFIYVNDGANVVSNVVTGKYVILTGPGPGTYTLTATVNNTPGTPSGLLVSAGVTCAPISVGGVAALTVSGPSSPFPSMPLAASAAAVVAMLAVAVWYARRRWLR